MPTGLPTTFPLRVKPFLRLEDGGLRRGDIILSRSRTLSSWLIRKTMGGYFSHAALVFFVPQPDERLENAFVLESTSAGVGLANLQSYVSRKSQTDIAVLRLEGAEFDDTYFKRVRGLMLDHVKSGYDYSRVLKLGLSFVFGMRLGWSSIRKGQKDSMQDAMRRTQRRRVKWVPPQFLCSGFIQYGFVETLNHENKDPELALFNETISVSNKDAILAVTPEDIATSKKLVWKFAIRRGFVHTATSYADARRIISGD
jgi:Permuted papain-like amidase enzyme, YaeF/YiiX, C92 family